MELVEISNLSYVKHAICVYMGKMVLTPASLLTNLLKEEKNIIC